MNHPLLKRTIIPIISFIAASSLPVEAYPPPGGMTRCGMGVAQSRAVVYASDDVDTLPGFPGGESERLNFINTTRRYPAEDYQRGVQGRVVCSFVVNVDGSISDASVIRSVSPTLDAEALRIINAMPRWISGVKDGENVPVYQVMSINFRL